MTTPESRDWNPYLAGVLLGLVLLATYLLMGYGLGGSAAATRFAVWGAHAVAPTAVETNAYFSQYFANGSPLNDWMIFEAFGVKVVVDPASAQMLVGATLDYKDGLQDAGFSINNPNASKTCGCGQSFS